MPSPLPRIIAAHQLDEVIPVLRAVEAAAAEGMKALGFVAYEAGPAFDAEMAAHPPVSPLAWFLIAAPQDFSCGLVECPEGAVFLRGPHTSQRLGQPVPIESFSPGLSSAAHAEALRQIREYLAQGRSYQVNYTFPLQSTPAQDPLALFHALCDAQGPGEYYYFDTREQQVLCVSPELFFSLDGEAIAMRPMKGTRPRGRWLEEDTGLAEELAASEKDQAENIMIVDMVRHDLGKISAPGAVQVDRLFSVERYETVWQMTSHVSARTQAGLEDIFRALFPCASVTGAPKIETMRIIRALEPQARGVYCGAAGWFGPGRQGRFSVAIRTAVQDRKSLGYFVGSGITWDSRAADEYRECLQKAAVLRAARPEFELLETLRWERGAFLLPGLHLERMRKSARYFGFECDIASLREKLDEDSRTRVQLSSGTNGPCLVRFLLDRMGRAHTEWHPVAATPFAWHASTAQELRRVCVANAPVNSGNVFLYHKTTSRQVYERLRAPQFDDAVLWNEDGEVTEATMANVVLEDDEGFWTPPRRCGLLVGTFREYLLRQGVLRERVILLKELANTKLWLINSVRGWMKAQVEAEPSTSRHSGR